MKLLQQTRSCPSPRSFIFLVPGLGTGTGGLAYNTRVAESISKPHQIELVDVYTDAHRFRESLPAILKRFAVYPRFFSFIFSLRMMRLHCTFPGIVLQDYEITGFTILLSWLRKLFGLKTITFVYHFDDREAKSRGQAIRIRKRRIGSSDKIITISDFTAREARLSGCSDSKIYIARPGTNPAPRNFHSESQAGHKQYVLTVANLFSHKGIDVLVNAAALCSNKNLLFLVAGNDKCDPEYTIKLNSLITDLGLQNRFFILGRVDNVRLQLLFQDALFFVMPSFMEGYCMAVAEARAYGKPVVSTNAGALPELVEHGVDGFLVEPGSSRALASAIDQLFENPRLLNDFKVKSEERAKNLPTWDQTCKTVHEALFG